jgi:hypothetical protein
MNLCSIWGIIFWFNLRPRRNGSPYQPRHAIPLQPPLLVIVLPRATWRRPIAGSGAATPTPLPTVPHSPSPAKSSPQSSSSRSVRRLALRFFVLPVSTTRRLILSGRSIGLCPCDQILASCGDGSAASDRLIPQNALHLDAEAHQCRRHPREATQSMARPDCAPMVALCTVAALAPSTSRPRCP